MSAHSRDSRGGNTIDFGRPREAAPKGTLYKGHGVLGIGASKGGLEFDNRVTARQAGGKHGRGAKEQEYFEQLTPRKRLPAESALKHLRRRPASLPQLEPLSAKRPPPEKLHDTPEVPRASSAHDIEHSDLAVDTLAYLGRQLNTNVNYVESFAESESPSKAGVFQFDVRAPHRNRYKAPLGEADVSFRGDSKHHGMSSGAAKVTDMLDNLYTDEMLKETEQKLKQYVASGPPPSLQGLPGGVNSDEFLTEVLTKAKEFKVPASRIPSRFQTHFNFPLAPQGLSGDVEISINDKKKRIDRLVFPSAMPSGRVEVILLAKTLDAMLSEYNKSHPDLRLPPEEPDFSAVGDKVTATANLFEEFSTFDFHANFYDQFQIWDIILAELVRQTYVHCIERGLLLGKVQQRYVEFYKMLLSLFKNFQRWYNRLLDRAIQVEEYNSTLAVRLYEQEKEIREFDAVTRDQNAIEQLEEAEKRIEELESLVAQQEKEAFDNTQEIENLNQQYSRLESAYDQLVDRVNEIEDEKETAEKALQELAFSMGMEKKEDAPITFTDAIMFVSSNKSKLLSGDELTPEQVALSLGVEKGRQQFADIRQRTQTWRQNSKPNTPGNDQFTCDYCKLQNLVDPDGSTKVSSEARAQADAQRDLGFDVEEARRALAAAAEAKARFKAIAVQLDGLSGTVQDQLKGSWRGNPADAFTTVDSWCQTDFPLPKSASALPPSAPARAPAVHAVPQANNNAGLRKRVAAGESVEQSVFYPKGYTGKLKSKKWLHETVRGIWLAKIEADKRDDAQGITRKTMIDFIYEHFMSQFGLQKLAAINIADLVATLMKYYTTNPKLKLFARSLALTTPVYQLEHINFFMDLYANVIKVAVDIDDHRDATAQALPIHEAERLVSASFENGILEIDSKIYEQLRSSAKLGQTTVEVGEGRNKKQIVQDVEIVETSKFMEALMDEYESRKRQIASSLTSVFRAADRNNDQSLSIDEFNHIVTKMLPDCPQTEVFRLFQEGTESYGQADIDEASFVKLLSSHVITGKHGRCVLEFSSSAESVEQQFAKVESQWERSQHLLTETAELLSDDDKLRLEEHMNQFQQLLSERTDPVATWLSYKLLMDTLVSLQQEKNNMDDAVTKLQAAFRGFRTRNQTKLDSTVDTGAKKKKDLATASLRRLGTSSDLRSSLKRSGTSNDVKRSPAQ